MALPFPVKGTMFFKDNLRGLGWTESVYIMNQNSLKDALVTLVGLAAKRMLLLAWGIYMERVTVSQDSPKLLGDVKETNILGTLLDNGQPYYDDQWKADPSDYAWTAALLRCSTEDGLYHRSWYLSGVPDSVTHDLETQIQDGPWRDRLAAMIAFMTVAPNKGLYGIKAFSKDPAGDKSPIFDIVKADSATSTLLFKFNPAYIVGDLIFVHGIIGSPKESRPHGVYQVTAVNGALVTIGAWAPVNPFHYQKGGYARIRITDVYPIDDINLRRTTKRSRGRPFGLPRGRSKAR